MKPAGFNPPPLQLRLLLRWEKLAGYLWYGVSSFATSIHAPRWRTGELQRILFVKTDHIGDFLLALPAVRDFLSVQSQARVGALVGSGNADLAERVAWIDEVHVHDSPRYVRHGKPSPDGNLRTITSRRWDLVIDLTNDPATAIDALRRPGRYRRDVGSFRLREKARKFLGRGEGLRHAHAATVFYRALGLPVPESIAPQPLTLRDEDRTAASALVSPGWPGDRPLAALHAGASWSYRRWPASRFQALALALEERGFAVYLVGGPNDEEISRTIVEGAELSSERNLAGRATLPECAAVLERCSVVVANDGGVMHLAANQGTPVVGIFGPQDPDLFAPLGSTSHALYRERDCSPCSQRHCVWGRSRCLEPIETEEVLAAALELAR